MHQKRVSHSPTQSIKLVLVVVQPDFGGACHVLEVDHLPSRVGVEVVRDFSKDVTDAGVSMALSRACHRTATRGATTRCSRHPKCPFGRRGVHSRVSVYPKNVIDVTVILACTVGAELLEPILPDGKETTRNGRHSKSQL